MKEITCLFNPEIYTASYPLHRSMMKDLAPSSRMSTKIFRKKFHPSRINIPEMADLHYSSFPEQLIELFLFHFQQGLQQNLE